MNVYEVKIRKNVLCSEELLLRAVSLSKAVENAEGKIKRAPVCYEGYEVVRAELIGELDN